MHRTNPLARPKKKGGALEKRVPRPIWPTRSARAYKLTCLRVECRKLDFKRSVDPKLVLGQAEELNPFFTAIKGILDQPEPMMDAGLVSVNLSAKIAKIC